MPEPPHSKLHRVPDARVAGISPDASPTMVPYVELHCKTNFSFLEGASHPDELVNRAAELGYAGLAITDRNSVAGVVRAHIAAKKVGLKLIIEAEVTRPDASTCPASGRAMDRAGWREAVSAAS